MLKSLVKSVFRHEKRMKTSEAVEIFLSAYSGLRAPKTLEWYETLLLRLSRWMKDKPIETITINDLRAFRASLLDGSNTKRRNGKATKELLSPYTIHATIKATRHLFSWLHQEGIIPANPAARLETPPLPGDTRQGIADNDADKMLKASRSHPRDYAILLFTRDTGCRVGGVSSLRLSNLQLSARDQKEKKRAVVIEKGNQTRVVFLSDVALEALQEWLEIRPDWISHDFVFTAYGGKPLEERGIYEIFRRVAKTAGVSDNWSPHHWRHRFARRMLAAGANLQQVSQIMGHKSIGVTSRFYGKLDIENVHDAYLRYYQASAEGVDGDDVISEEDLEAEEDLT